MEGIETDSKIVREKLTAHIVAMDEGVQADLLDSLVEEGDEGQGSVEKRLLRFFDNEMDDGERAVFLQSFEDNK